MKFRGADIRIVGITKSKVVELVREFIDSNKLHIEHIEHEEVRLKATHITASNPIASYLKFWWKETPQVIDWKIVELGEKETKIETRFGLQRKFRIWFWSIGIILSFLFAIFHELGINPSFSKSIEAFAKISLSGISYTVISVLMLLTAAVFFGKGLGESYASFLKSFKEFVHITSLNYSEKIIQHNSRNPQFFAILFYFVAALTLFVAKNSDSFMRPPFSLPLFIFIAVCLFFLLVVGIMLYFLWRRPDSSARFFFALVSLSVFISVSLFYSLPFINVVIGNQPIFFLETNTTFEMVKHNVVLWEAIKRHFTIAICAYLTFILIAIGWFFGIPQSLRSVRNWKDDLFSGHWTPLHRKIVAVRGLKGELSYLVLAIWIVLSSVLYVLMYETLSILEFGIFKKQLLFRTSIGEMFCNDSIAGLNFFLAPLIGPRLATLTARAALIAYCIPLLWLFYKIVKKRGQSYFNNLREVRGFLLNKQSDIFGLCKVAIEMAQSLGMKQPDIVMVPSKIPIVCAKYMGFPYFRSYVLISHGCSIFEQEEMWGLLAHEIYHVKEHSLKWHVLNLLSDYTFFGSGFLAIVTNSYQRELDADYYAAKWLSKKGSVSSLIKGLQIMEVVESAFNRKEGELKLTSSRHQGNKEGGDNEGSALRRFKKNIDLLCEFYFGDKILSYIHPPLEERIERIRAVAEGRAEG